MQKFLVLVVLLGLLSLPLMAQDYPKAEVFGGYQFLHSEGENFNGWNASVTGNLNRAFGVTGDFSGSYKTISGIDFKVYTYTGGPVLNLNHEGTVNPFVHALVGGAHFVGSASGASASINGFTMMFGGGVDAKMNKRVALRGQVDWVYYHVSGAGSSKNVRMSIGPVFRF